MTDTPHRDRISRRAVLRGMLSATGVALLAACQAPAAPSPAAAPTAAKAPAPAPTAAAAQSAPTAGGAPVVGGTFRFGQVGDLTSLDGHLVFPGMTSTLWMVWDRLTAYDTNLQPQPMLAERWEQTPDATQITLHLRKGVQWHSGREFTSEDVAWNLKRTRDVKVGGGIPLSLSQPLKSWETPDKYTVVMKSDPWPAVFGFFEYTNILDPVSMDSPEANKTAIGTGPFKFAEWSPGSHLLLVKNPSYWQAGKPYLEQYRTQIFNDAQGMVSQLEGGALDAITTPTLVDTVRLQKEGKFTVLTNAYTGGWTNMLANTKNAPTSDKRVRQALSYAIDRKRIAEQVYLGLNEPRALPWPPFSPAYDETKKNAYPFDLEKARSLLAAAGHSNLQLDLQFVAAGAEARDVAQILQSDLATIGVTLNLRPVDQTTNTNTLTTATYQHLILSGGITAQLHPGIVGLGPYYSPVYNWSSFKDDALTAIVAGVTSETDPAKQKQVFQQWNDFVLDQSWVFVLTSNAQRAATRPNVRGLGYTMHESLDLRGTWLAP
jgi:peptide/nickel transport system substrate-binding protein